MSDDLRTSRMIGCLDGDDLRHEKPVVLLDEAKELVLRRRRADDQNGVYSIERMRDLLEEAMRIIWVHSRLPTPFRMPMHEVLRRENR